MNHPLRYLALGDSITSGLNVNENDRFPVVLASIIQQHIGWPVHLWNGGRNGLTSSGLLKGLKTRQGQIALQQAIVVTLNIGGDDLIHAYLKWRLLRNKSYLRKGLDKLQQNYVQICRILQQAQIPQVVMGTIYNPFPNTPFARAVIQEYNGRIWETATHFGYPVADLFHVFEGAQAQLIDHYRTGRLEDYIPFMPHAPIHPNALGYDVIAHTYAHFIL